MRTRTMARLIGVLVLGFCLFPLTAYAGFGGVVHDAIGDWIFRFGKTSANPYMDIKKVQFHLNKTMMTITFTLADVVPLTPSSERLFYWIGIDSDQNPTTGRPDPDIHNGFRADYEVAVCYDSPPGSWFYTLWNNTQWPSWTSKSSAGSYLISENRVRMSFPLSQIASPAHFNVVFATWELNPSMLIDAIDRAPNTGIITLGK